MMSPHPPSSHEHRGDRMSMDARVARVEVEVGTLTRDVAGLRADQATMKSELKADIKGVGESVAKSIKELGAGIDSAKEKAVDAKRPNWQAISVGVAILGMFQVAAMACIAYYSHTNAVSNRDLVKSVSDVQTAVMNGFTLQIQFLNEQQLEARKDQDQFRRDLNDLRKASGDADSAAMAQISSVHRTLTWLQGQFEGEQRIRDWQTDLFREYDITPRPEDDQP